MSANPFTFPTNEGSHVYNEKPSEMLSPDQYSQFKLFFWSTIVEADNRIDNQAQILSKDATLILESGAHLPRSDKGAILRRETYQKFERQISQAYERLQDANEYDTNYFLDGKLLEENTQALIQNRLDLRKPDRACDFDAALFELGMKSL
ncbi:hypothetical protein K432DRAFT_406797 [Lepidopterella palustris CBS 459.81]|uniref:Uncharacterized protein n=1 Tax=Lepidopterella palustris CBS 459.81 TaxID=1314670 RepID=A0A8E2E6A4_9PEZI|nr:hypothetical protein K432DRAFT_406797 [Lepidopterella palustris CBS 459.81]